MRPKQSALQFFTIISLFLVLLFGLFYILTQTTLDKNQQKLPIPILLEDMDDNPDVSVYQLVAQQGTMEFLSGKHTQTLGYNGSYLGPTIKVKNGELVNISVKNQLNEETTVHWHGLVVPGEADGGPHQVITPFGEWETRFIIDQPAATLWYHPHGWGNTASQVYRGLAGLILVEDEASKALNLPNQYGVDDIPLVIQDRSISSLGQFRRNQHMMRRSEDYIMINGVIHPYVEVNKGKIRFRILNASNEMNLNLYLSDNKQFHQIASDGGLLEEAVIRNSMFLSPAERVEVIVDFSTLKVGTKVTLRNGRQDIMTVIVRDQFEDTSQLPQVLSKIENTVTDSLMTVRSFVLSTMGNTVAINRKSFDLHRIDETTTTNTPEIWEISVNDHMMMGGQGHPFHVHGTQFRILARNNQPPEKYEQGWKDTVFIQNNETVRILIEFKFKGLYMYHCHILEHEEQGMMGQILVE